MIHRCAEHGRPYPSETHRWVCPCGQVWLSSDGGWHRAGVDWHRQPPIRKWRGVVVAFLLIVVVFAVSAALDPLIGGLHWLLSGFIAGLVGYTVYAVLLHLLRPWYRPIPKREQWTEDAL